MINKTYQNSIAERVKQIINQKCRFANKSKRLVTKIPMKKEIRVMNRSLALPLIFVASLISGCGATSHGVQKLGPDIYTVGAEVLLGPSKAGAARAEAFRLAEDHCKSMGRQVLVDSYQTRGSAMAVNGEAFVNFRCLTEGDPQLNRPNFRPAPSMIIEDQRMAR